MVDKNIKKFVEAIKNNNDDEARKYLEKVLQEKTAKRIKKVLNP